MVLAYLGLSSFLGYGNFNAKAGLVLCKPRQLVTLTYNNVFLNFHHQTYCSVYQLHAVHLLESHDLMLWFVRAPLVFSHCTLKRVISFPFQPELLSLRCCVLFLLLFSWGLNEAF